MVFAPSAFLLARCFSRWRLSAIIAVSEIEKKLGADKQQKDGANLRP